MSEESWEWVAYVDETFNADAYWICMVLVHVDDIREAQDSLDAVVRRWAEEFEVATDAELHGGDLWHGSGPYAGIAPGIRRALYDDALEVIRNANPRIVLRGVARRRLTVADPHRIAWRYAVESVDEVMEGVDGRALLLADEHQTERELRGDIVEYVQSTTGGWKPRTITRVLPNLRFFGSHENRLLQAADLVAFVHQRRKSVATETNARAQSAREGHWAKIAPHVVVERLWMP
jgi:hypothetical protein